MTDVVIGSGGVVSPVIASGAAAANIVKIGAAGAGATLGVSPGSTFTHHSATLGDLAGQTGGVTVSGAGTTWNSQYLYTGFRGTGVFTLSGGAAANVSSFVQTGTFAGSSGTVTVTGAGTAWNAANGHITGDSGQGVLNVLNGAHANERATTLGDKATGNGTATVDASFLNVELTLVVGNYGTGHLGISNGGDVQAGTYFVVGWQAGGVGSLTVDGAGSSLNVMAPITNSVVGWGGSGSVLISNGGTVSALGGVLGRLASGSGTLRVTGANSLWNDTLYLLVGYGGGGTLTVDNGGMVRVSGGTGRIFIANLAGSNGTVNIGAASGSAAQAAGTLDVAELRFGAGTGRLVLNHIESNYVLAPAITGNGTVLVENGTTVLAGANTYSGSTLIRSGTLELGSATAAGTSVIELGGGSGSPTLRFGGSYAVANAMTMAAGGGTIDTASNSIVMSGALGGAGGFTKTGTGSLTLTGTGTYAGPTTVNGGLLVVNGAIGGSGVTVSAGATLGGTGTINAATAITGGTLQAGNLTINGALSLSSASVYAFTPSSLTTVNGSATLGGAALPFVTTSFQAQTHTVLTASGGVNGTFTLAGTGGSTASVIYGANDVTLTVNGYRAAASLIGTGSVNVQNVATGIDRALNGGTVPAAAWNALIGLAGAPLASQLNALTGEAGTGAVSSGITGASTFLNIMLDPMAGARGAMADAPGSSLIEMADIASARAPAARVEAGWSIWTKAYGQSERTASDTGLGAAGTASSLYGVAAGADRLISPGLLVGFALAGGGTSFGLGALGSGTGDFAQLGAYASMRLGPGYVSAALAYGWNRFDVTRNVAALGLTETYRSGPVGHTFGGRIETGRRFAVGGFGLGRLGLTPYAAAEAIAYVAPGYRENWTAPATGAFALAYVGRTTATLRGEFGARADALVAAGETGDLIAFSRLAYAVQSNTQRGAAAQFQTLAGSTFTVFGARASTHTALATIGAEARFRQGTRVSLALDGELGERHRSIRGSVGLRQSW
ncbi:autotransporter outer membrane beta-barrel domain-containing protein [Phreatobacter stygius]|uniref:autotransporter outer membrane beta-barrel domain-containing protein n=1 Tax=Phreatobacter stygius TaxID=1940610 RepID=UPI001476BCFB|nr:autotransporter outer membrane beta-barrel domain-containing protein [Phreatobacter stygius]